MGYLFQQYEHKIRLNIFMLIPLGILAYVAKDSLFYLSTSSLFFAYLVFYLAYVPKGFLRKYNELGDYSYGFYVYAFPVQQTLYHYRPNISFSEMVYMRH
jgi:peptidoglycan/LPS O-acetylase OafA/YrhL